MSSESQAQAVVPTEGTDIAGQFTGDKYLAGQEGTPSNPGVPSYVSYVWPKTTNEELKAQIRDAGGTIPTFVLSRAGFIQPIRPFRFHFFHGTTIATQNNQAGQIINAEPRMPHDLPKEVARTWAEHTYAVVGVLVGEGNDAVIVPAHLHLRSGSRRALTNAEVNTRDAADPRWARRGPAFKTAYEGTEYVPGRLIAFGSISAEKQETSGHIMLVGKCTVSPSKPEDLARFNAAMKDSQFRKDLEATIRVYAAKLKSLLSKQMDEPEDE